MQAPVVSTRSHGRLQNNRAITLPHIITCRIVIKMIPGVSTMVNSPRAQGHRHDWEWVIVVFKNFGGTYYRDRIIMEQDGGNAEYMWKDPKVQTFMDAGDMWNNDLGGKDRNHPKIYVTKMHHSMWPNVCHGGIKDDCFGTFRPDDWYMFDFSDASNLVDIGAGVNNGGIDGNWDFGRATNPWWTVGGMCDMCKSQSTLLCPRPALKNILGTFGGDYQENCAVNFPDKCWKENGVCVCHGPFAAQSRNETLLQKQELKH
jgi:hypothetical protein